MRLVLLILLAASAQCSRKEFCSCRPESVSSPNGRRIQAQPAIGPDYFRRNKIKEMAQHAWQRTREDHSTLAIVSAMSTLKVMGLRSEFQEAVALIQRNNMTKYTSVFTPASWSSYTVGGLLSAHALTGDTVFRVHAAIAANHDVGGELGIPQLMGGFLLEAHHLQVSGAAGNRSVYAQAAAKVRWWLRTVPTNLHFAHDEWGQSTGEWSTYDFEVQNRIHDDLLRMYMATKGEDSEIAQMLDNYVGTALSSIQQSEDGRYFTSTFNDGVMTAASCSLGGFLALLSRVRHAESSGSSALMQMAEGMARTCRDATVLNRRLEPASFCVDPISGAINVTETKHSLGQATVESYFILWRLTHNETYRRWGWDTVLGLERSRRHANRGYVELDEWQPPFFIAATLKYLYLLFSGDDDYSLDEWVFSRTGQLFPL